MKSDEVMEVKRVHGLGKAQRAGLGYQLCLDEDAEPQTGTVRCHCHKVQDEAEPGAELGPQQASGRQAQVRSPSHLMSRLSDGSPGNCLVVPAEPQRRCQAAWAHLPCPGQATQLCRGATHA